MKDNPNNYSLEKKYSVIFFVFTIGKINLL
jgi:hypothetical protein